MTLHPHLHEALGDTLPGLPTHLGREGTFFTFSCSPLEVIRDRNRNEKIGEKRVSVRVCASVCEWTWEGTECKKDYSETENVNV